MGSISLVGTTGAWSKGRLVFVGATIFYALTFVVALALRAFRPEVVPQHSIKLFSNVAQLGAPLFAGCCAFYLVAHIYRAQRTLSPGWFLLGMGSLLYATGQALFMFYDLRGESPFPSWADAGFAGAYPVLVVGVTLLFGALPLVGRVRHLLDSATVASGVGIISWHFVIERLWAQSDESLLTKVLSVFYPLGDVALLFGATALLYGSWAHAHLRRPYALLAGGAVFFALTDTVWNFYVLNGTYHTGSWLDAGWTLGYGLIGYAPLWMLWQKTPDVPAILEGETRAMNWVQAPRPSSSTLLVIVARLVLPYLLALCAWVIVVSHDYRQDHIISTSTYVSGFWLMFLVIVRQVMTMLHNHHLTHRLQEFNLSLEQTIARRTHQIKSLFELTKAVNTSLQASDVLESALAHTREGMNAGAVVLRLCEAGNCAQSASVLEQGLEKRPDVSGWIKELPLALQIESVRTPGDQENSMLLRAPLRWRDTHLGDISVLREGAGTFSQGEHGMLESIGLAVAAAYRNAQIHAVAVEHADRDSITGLFNHRAIHERLQNELERAERSKRPLAVIMMDLNNFKLFNDTYGHPVGDQVLKRVAVALESKCRKLDILGRYGGDEFIAVLPETDLPLAMVVAQRWRERMELEGFHFAGDEERVIPVSLSFGIATYPADSTNRFELVSVADANLYSAKLSEKGIVGTSETQRQNRQLKTESSFDVLDAMVTAVDNKDSYTRRHSEDVTEFALWIAEELGLSSATMRVVRLTGLLHDVGKIGVPEAVLKKPGRLTDEEFDVMKGHAQFGAFIVGGVPDMGEIVPGVRSHHERWDGRGYPDGLAGEAIPLLGRLLAVADACSAMTTSRPYRQALEWKAALKEIEANTGTQFDPEMAQAFLRAARKKRPDAPEAKTPRLQLVEGARNAASR
jgi:diguanylate cyclase (GGDEF)-like protein